MYLKQLLADFDVHLSSEMMQLKLTGISLNSENLKPGDVFVAIKGGDKCGLDYLGRAYVCGAVALFVDEEALHLKLKNGFLIPDLPIPVIKIAHLSARLPLLAKRLYPNACKACIIGITGTNGKTSVAIFTAALFTKCGKKVASIGTLGVHIYDTRFTKENNFSKLVHTTMHTTPDIFTLYKILSCLNKNNLDYVVLEISSHALVQNRLAGLNIHYALFTNLSQDHLDYHKTMENYRLSKQKLFERPELKAMIINSDDKFAKRLLNLKIKAHKVAYGLDFMDKDLLKQPAAHIPFFKLENYQIIKEGYKARVENKTFSTALLGVFNMVNLLASYALLRTIGFEAAKITAHLGTLQAPEGRMMRIKNRQNKRILIDFAHTPDALEKALSALKAHYPTDNIWLLFGCGGNRDKKKRAEMGSIANLLADKIILSSDNPRDEAPEKIISNIKKGINLTDKLTIILDREKAIRYAVCALGANESLLIAGRGCEMFQEVRGKKIALNDAQVVKNVLC